MPERERPLPPEPLEYRQDAQEHMDAGAVPEAIASALLAVAGDLAAIRRQLEKQGRR